MFNASLLSSFQVKRLTVIICAIQQYWIQNHQMTVVVKFVKNLQQKHLSIQCTAKCLKLLTCQIFETKDQQWFPQQKQAATKTVPFQVQQILLMRYDYHIQTNDYFIACIGKRVKCLNCDIFRFVSLLNSWSNHMSQDTHFVFFHLCCIQIIEK